MTVSVRPWDQIAADLRNFDAPTYDMSVVRREAAVAGDALAAELARLDGYLTNCDAAREEVIAQRDTLAAVVAAVHAALDQYDNADSPSGHGPFAAAECVSAVAEACGR